MPTAEAALLALRQQQVIAEETGVATHDRPAGRLLVRRVADQPRPSARSGATSTRSIARGGMVAAVAPGYPQREIADAAYRFQREVDAGERRIVGVNAHVDPDEVLAMPLLQVPAGSLERHLARLERDAPRAGRRGRRARPWPACATRRRARSRRRRT